MTLGAGIAIAGVWLFPAACALARSVTPTGMNVATILALLITATIVL